MPMFEAGELFAGDQSIAGVWDLGNFPTSINILDLVEGQ